MSMLRLSDRAPRVLMLTLVLTVAASSGCGRRSSRPVTALRDDSAAESKAGGAQVARDPFVDFPDVVGAENDSEAAVRATSTAQPEGATGLASDRSELDAELVRRVAAAGESESAAALRKRRRQQLLEQFLTDSLGESTDSRLVSNHQSSNDVTSNPASVTSASSNEDEWMQIPQRQSGTRAAGSKVAARTDRDERPASAAGRAGMDPFDVLRELEGEPVADAGRRASSAPQPASRAAVNQFPGGFDRENYKPHITVVRHEAAPTKEVPSGNPEWIQEFDLHIGSTTADPAEAERSNAAAVSSVAAVESIGPPPVKPSATEEIEPTQSDRDHLAAMIADPSTWSAPSLPVPDRPDVEESLVTANFVGSQPNGDSIMRVEANRPVSIAEYSSLQPQQSAPRFPDVSNPDGAAAETGPRMVNETRMQQLQAPLAPDFSETDTASVPRPASVTAPAVRPEVTQLDVVNFDAPEQLVHERPGDNWMWIAGGVLVCLVGGFSLGRFRRNKP